MTRDERMFRSIVIGYVVVEAAIIALFIAFKTGVLTTP
jgi:hypothetical protein